MTEYSNLPFGVEDAKNSSASSLLGANRHKPSIGESIFYVCITVLILGCLAFTAVLICCTSIGGVLSQYLAKDHCFALMALNTFPVGLLCGLLWPKVWHFLKEQFPLLN